MHHAKLRKREILNSVYQIHNNENVSLKHLSVLRERWSTSLYSFTYGETIEMDLTVTVTMCNAGLGKRGIQVYRLIDRQKVNETRGSFK